MSTKMNGFTLSKKSHLLEKTAPPPPKNKTNGIAAP